MADTRGRILANLSDGQSVMETSPTWAPDNRRIAFAGGWRGSSIWLTNRAGGPVKRFLANGGQPAWAPNGKTLAFTYFHGWYGTERRVETIGIDRTGRRVIATDASDPTWSPDSRRLAFVTKTGAGASEITVANSDGSGARALTASREEEFAPAWSPNGKWIAFERREPDDRNDRHWIVVVDAETSVERWTIRGGHGLHDPSWRPQVLLPRARRGSCR